MGTWKKSSGTPPPTVWIITEGIAGTENQCLGVAEALGVEPVVKRVNLTLPWRLLSPYLRCEIAKSFSEPLSAPWPDILLTSGRKSIAASRYIKRQSQGKTFTVQIQDPRVSPSQFDLVAIPEHDPTRGENVVVTTATPNRISEQKLQLSHDEFSSLLAPLPSPRLAILIGGSTKSHIFTSDEAQNLSTQLTPLVRQGFGLMVTTSRRTGTENQTILRHHLDSPSTLFWDGTPPNPYMGFLAWADAILVTADSTSMISEAATTGKPVYVLPMNGLSKRQSRLVENLKTYGAVRDFNGTIDHWTYPKLRDASKIAEEIQRKSGLFGI